MISFILIWVAKKLANASLLPVTYSVVSSSELEQSRKKWDELCADQCNTTASHELCYTKFVGNIRVYQVAKIIATLVRRSFIELS